MTLKLKSAVGIAVSLLLLWWALRDVSFLEVAHHVMVADPILFGIAIAIATSGLAVRALRWRLLLLPLSPSVPFRARYAATSIGFAANNLLPARVGEFARALALGRLTGLPVGGVFGSLALERAFDGVALLLLFFIALMGSVPVDPGAAAGLAVVGVVGTAIILGVLLPLALAPERSLVFVERVGARLLPGAIRRPVLDAAHAFVQALALVRSVRLLLLSFLWAMGQWLYLALSFHLALRAFGITEVSFLGAVFLQSLVGFAVAIPSSPGFFGPFEAVTKLGLAIWGISAGKAISFAIGFHIGGFIPVTLIGMWYVWRMEIRWSEMERSDTVVEEEVEHDTVAAARSADAEGR